ncbi:M57 family metalloprotease [Streptococcus sp. IsoGale021]|uniref:matrixin family metalloprotease n=1 Tax=Streptococcus TaxID=1301 RepID=UPI0020014DB3|nr:MULTISPECIES: M57 family metalloprotease [Streptococcus]MCY7210795.1 M57 family metalloprotease [Streptococcus anginosus]MCY7212523.1 M57 family metalloprotease [Streptococcus anginosus]MCY7226223.1 M57 family metalloprotease [Streptococcus anginosus]MDQ8695259.1 M57 family metalloprotease [Streptococcus sp. IsoGale021]MDU5129052.1 M57 family metalloprotease [Streptococcus anginosus]
MRFIFRIFSALLRLIWRLVYSLALTALFLVGILYIMSPSKSSFSTTLQQDVSQIYRYVSGQDSQLGVGQNVRDLTKQLSDNHVHQASGVRWDTASATVYIDTQDETFRSAYQEAIRTWNQTGAFTFQIVNDKSQANIVATEMNDGTVSAAGEAESQTNLLTKRFTNVTVRLNRYYLLNSQYGYSYERIVNTAEHELGHAIGLEHNEEKSVMQSSGSFYEIQAVDVQAVKELYQA